MSEQEGGAPFQGRNIINALEHFRGAAADGRASLDETKARYLAKVDRQIEKHTASISGNMKFMAEVLADTLDTPEREIKKQNLLSIMQWTADDLGTCFYARATLQGTGKDPGDALVAEAAKAGADFVVGLTQTPAGKAVLAHELIVRVLAKYLLYGITSMDLFVTKGMNKLQDEWADAFNAAVLETKGKLARGEITQAQANEIFISTHPDGGEMELLQPGTAYRASPEMQKLFDGQEAAVTAYLAEIMRLMGFPPTKTTKPTLQLNPRRHGNEPTTKRARIASPYAGQLTIYDAAYNMGFMTIRQSRPYNDLIHSITATPKIDPHYNQKLIEGIRKDTRIIITGTPQSVKRLRPSAAKLLDNLQIILTRQGMGDMYCALPLREYMETRGLKDIKEARKQVEEDLRALHGISETFRDPKGGSMLTVSISGGTFGIKQSTIFFKFNDDWMKLFPTDQLMFIPRSIFKTNDKRNPHSYLFGRAVAEHRRKNIGHKNEFTMSVKAITAASPAFPDYDDLGEKKHVTQQIIEPFERDMDAAAEAGMFKWHYTGIEGDDGPATYDQFIDAKIQITWDAYPDIAKIRKDRRKFRQIEKNYRRTEKDKKIAGKCVPAPQQPS